MLARSIANASTVGIIHMEKPYLYILCGVPFSGKTTVATALADWLDINRVAIDDINNERNVWDDETGMSPEEWTRTYDEAYRRLGLILSQEKSA